MSSLEDSIKVWRTNNAALLSTDDKGNYWFNNIPAGKFDEFKQNLVNSLNILTESCPNVMENQELADYFAKVEIYLSENKNSNTATSQ